MLACVTAAFTKPGVLVSLGNCASAPLDSSTNVSAAKNLCTRLPPKGKITYFPLRALRQFKQIIRRAIIRDGLKVMGAAAVRARFNLHCPVSITHIRLATPCHPPPHLFAIRLACLVRLVVYPTEVADRLMRIFLVAAWLVYTVDANRYSRPHS